MKSFSRKHPRLLRCALTAAASVALLLGLEAAARIALPSRPAVLLSTDGPVQPKRPGTYRIVFAGGSTVEGFPVRALGFVEQLAFWLERLAPERVVELVNLAQPARPSTFVRTTVEHALRFDPDLFVVLTGHNEFLNRAVDRVDPQSTWEQRSALVRAVRKVRRKVWPESPEREATLPERLAGYSRTTATFGARVERFRSNVEEVGRIARSAGVPLILCTAPANLADWPPVYHRLPNAAALEARAERIEVLLAARAWEAAGQEAARGRAAEENGAIFAYLLGRAQRGAGRFAEASRSFLEAKDEDPFPWRVLSAFNRATRRAAERSACALVDVEKEFAAFAPDAMVGFELISDNCHPTPLGAALIARCLLERMGRDGLLFSEPPSLPAPAVMLETYLSEALDSVTRAASLKEHALKNAAYTMATPYHYFQATRRYLDVAEELDPGEWRVWANRATLSMFEGSLPQARSELEEAVRLKGAPLDLRDRAAHPYLGEALEASGLAPPAHPMEPLREASGRGS